MTTALAGSLAVLAISGSVRSGVSENRAVAQPEPMAISAISGALTASMRPNLSAPLKNSQTSKTQALRRPGRVTVR